jgi:hypothetical protein
MPIITAKDFSSVGARAAAAAKPSEAAAPAPAAPTPLSEEKGELCRVRESLQQSEEFNQALLHTPPISFFELRKDGLIVSFHAPTDNDFHLTPETVIGKRVMDLVTSQVGQVPCTT